MSQAAFFNNKLERTKQLAQQALAKKLPQQNKNSDHVQKKRKELEQNTHKKKQFLKLAWNETQKHYVITVKANKPTKTFRQVDNF